MLLIGCDPELFVRKNGSLVSAFGLVQGTKELPFKVDKGAVQVDGMALEFNIEPASTCEEFKLNIKTVMGQLEKMVEGYTFDISSVAHFGKEYIAEQPDEAKELGCTPDFNAWTGLKNPRPDADMPFRTASGHIHVGWTQGADPDSPEHYMECRVVCAELDYTLGLASLLLDPDGTRRELYGKAGAFRPKSYGVEYRVLSNFWLKDDKLIDWVFRTVSWTLQRRNEGKLFREQYTDTAARIIDSNDVEAAKELIEKLGIDLP